MQVSSKVLIDIPFDGIIKGDEKIIFLSKKDFSIESISLRIRNFLYGAKMKAAAANHVKSLLSLPAINHLAEVRTLSASIKEKKEVATEDLIDIFMKIEHENQFNKLIGKPTTEIKIPEELRTIINERMGAKLTAELEAINKEENLPTENLNEIISLIRKISVNSFFGYASGMTLTAINTCDLKNLKNSPDYDNGILKNLMPYLNELKKKISGNEESDYKNKINASIDKLATKIRDIIKIEENTAKKAERDYTSLEYYLLNSTEVSIFGNEKKVYSDSEVKMIKKIINTSFQNLNKQINSQDKNQYRELLIRIEQNITFGPGIQNQQQILANIRHLKTKINTISVPRSKH
jgi:hypothetical protein